MTQEQHGDVVTMSKRGQWVNRVEGEEELSQGYATKEEAIDAGRRMAEESGTRHRVVDAEPTGVVTDEQVEGERPARAGSRGDDRDGDDGIAVADLP
ncbi:DUF2188 domain-containing protein [Microbacterium sp.]|uniref:DUF2188 domain-containing protein n=1 Tax=Microbacterium sp. TaxID=51671 RepID=UPI0028115E96|nr:DUF2188 domain-containing protein [Microbacterium sp.]